MKMKIQKVGTRGFLFTFEEPYKTNVYVINSNQNLFICDTFLGNDPMNKIMRFFKKEEDLNEIPKIIFNSHYDYDHVWGNGYYKDSIILSHHLCRKILKKEGYKSLEKYCDHKMGEVTLRLPNLTFSSKILFNNEKVQFFYSPGHTVDSSSCYDLKENILFVGDNIEFPYPYIRILDIEKFIGTLNDYLKYDPDYLITGHTDLIKGNDEVKKILKSQLKYVTKFKEKDINIDLMDKSEKILHFSNLKERGNRLKSNNQLKEAKYFFEEAKYLISTLPKEMQGKEEQLNELEEILQKLRI